MICQYLVYIGTVAIQVMGHQHFLKMLTWPQPEKLKFTAHPALHLKCIQSTFIGFTWWLGFDVSWNSMLSMKLYNISDKAWIRYVNGMTISNNLL